MTAAVDELSDFYLNLQEIGFSALMDDDTETAADFLGQAYRIKYGKPRNECHSAEEFWNQTFPAASSEKVSLSKLFHDYEQIQWLVQQNRLPEAEFAPYLQQLEQYCLSLKARIRPDQTAELFTMTPAELQTIRPGWLRTYYIEPMGEPFPLLNPVLDWDHLAWQYQKNAPGFALGDDVLTPQALDAMYRMFMNTTHWHDYGRGNYVGSYMLNGLSHPLIFRLGAELRQRLHTLLPFPLTMAWAYHYDATSTGVGLHADNEGRININFWLTPNEANRYPGGGGLVMYDVLAPIDWEPHSYRERMTELIGIKEYKAYHIPYQQNRMQIFDSRLFHHTEPFQFRPEYCFRRINLGMLYGFQKVPLEDQRSYRWHFSKRYGAT